MKLGYREAVPVRRAGARSSQAEVVELDRVSVRVQTRIYPGGFPVVAVAAEDGDDVVGVGRLAAVVPAAEGVDFHIPHVRGPPLVVYPADTVPTVVLHDDDPEAVAGIVQHTLEPVKLVVVDLGIAFMLV